MKKYRDRNKLFIIEGNRILADLLRSGELNSDNTYLIAATTEWKKSQADINSELVESAIETDPALLKKLSAMVNAPDVLAVVKIPSAESSFSNIRNGLSFAFESIRDPGNLGTIIRTADWFGINKIFCSPDSVDAYNSKVVQASMGAILRICPDYIEMNELFSGAGRYKVPVYGTTLDGNNLYDTPVKNPAIILFGNEASGLSENLYSHLRDRIRIPENPPGNSGSESLNVASSVAVIAAELTRRLR